MAVQAYVLVDCAPGKPFQIVEALRKLPAVEMAHAVTGSYDVIVFVQAESMAELGDLLSRHIHRLPGIVKTTTNLVVEKSRPARLLGEKSGKAGMIQRRLCMHASTPRGEDP